MGDREAAYARIDAEIDEVGVRIDGVLRAIDDIKRQMRS